ncbi:MAG TPA: hypothetical protein VGK73_20155 [Polyangiaceae bacterium]
MHHGVGLAVSALIVAELCVTARAQAEPQGHVALRTAVCGSGEHGALWQESHFCGSVIGDLLFFRQRNRDFGFGPYLELTTAGFFDVRWGGGASLLIPILEDLPLVIELGGYGHELEAAALGGSVFWGARSYNFTSAYNVSVGAFISAYRDLDERGANLLVAGFELDGFVVALPFLLGWEALQ